jgi:hypothetical protein
LDSVNLPVPLGAGNFWDQAEPEISCDAFAAINAVTLALNIYHSEMVRFKRGAIQTGCDPK